jgi:hypothetical protein
MNIPVGRIIRVDMGEDRWGQVLYMVVNPPIVCEHCNAVIFEWRSSQGDVICPDCGQIVRARFYYPCPRCHGNDYHTLRVVNNNNWYYDSVSGLVNEYNDKAGRVLNICGKSLMDDLKHQRMYLLTANETQDVKRKLAWTGCDDYDSTKPMPQWVIDKFPYGAQK